MRPVALAFRQATQADRAALLAQMRLFYAEDRIAFDQARARTGVEALLADPRNGEALLWLDAQAQVAGYAVMTLGFSLEQGGTYALLDELYLSPALRGGGLGRQALAIIEQRARLRGVGRLRLEVNHHNAAAKRLYLSCGYLDEGRDLLTRSLSPLQEDRP
ncbi:GNAT family N-acetyltransferase [Pseudoxanthomonas composti]|uniref:GNAT family N-acetyltransferase n=1 Tax=Pseudoxanthomonas composti TaxID=2137479 RepID=A0A4Q1JUS0_9GAMM|nr:GNAT family N-acetyltransferase [Pseudoxanthomonas composti]RXR05470.1 GNAT family N-acetyltransferase [Pseudoxanthomonas composti]